MYQAHVWIYKMRECDVCCFFLFSSVNSLSLCFASMYFMCTHIMCRAQYNNKEEAKKNNNQLYRINLCAAGRQCTQITHTCTRYTTIHTLQTFRSEFTIFKFIASLFAIFVSFLYQFLTLTASERCKPIVNAPDQLASFIAALIRSLLSAYIPIMWGFEREKYFDCENETDDSHMFIGFPFSVPLHTSLRDARVHWVRSQYILTYWRAAVCF